MSNPELYEQVKQKIIEFRAVGNGGCLVIVVIRCVTPEFSRMPLVDIISDRIAGYERDHYPMPAA